MQSLGFCLCLIICQITNYTISLPNEMRYFIVFLRTITIDASDDGQ